MACIWFYRSRGRTGTNVAVQIVKMIHILLHFVVPIFISLLFFKSEWKSSSLWIISTMIVDLDHLLADPIFDPNRCSINFHPLHSYEFIAVYALIFMVAGVLRYRESFEGGNKTIRILFLVSLGLLIHMVLDWFDCLFS